MKKEENLLMKARKKGVLTMAHRGNCTSALVDNTCQAFAHTLNQGADILEMDVFSSTDGELFLFHTGMERVFLQEDIHVDELDGAQIRKLRQFNRIGELTGQGIDRLEDALKLTKDRCILNLDRCDKIFGQVTELVKKYGMEDQILLKSVPTRENLFRMEREGAGFMYMPIQRYSLEGLDWALESNLNVVGIELTFDDADMVSPERMKKWHEKGYVLLTNSLSLGGRTLNAGHDDDMSVSNGPDQGWGWLADRGFDIIQTDYTDRLTAYLRRRGI